MNLKSKSIGALLGFTVAVSSALPATAAMTRAPLPAPAITESNVENVQRRRIRRNRGFRNRRYRSRRNRGGAIIGGVIAGAIIGGAIRESRARRRDRRSSRYSRHVDWCYDRYRSYRESSDTYQPFNGRRRLCNSPYN